MARVRRVEKEAKAGGIPCNDTLSETIPCGVESCGTGEQIDCKWGDWEPWGACDKCGGEKRRYRHIERMPDKGGKHCEYKASEEFTNCTRHCHTRQFCVWGDWSDWNGQCSSTCGNGYKKRERALKVLPFQETAATTPAPEAEAAEEEKEVAKKFAALKIQTEKVQNRRVQEM